MVLRVSETERKRRRIIQIPGAGGIAQSRCVFLYKDYSNTPSAIALNYVPINGSIGIMLLAVEPMIQQVIASNGTFQNLYTSVDVAPGIDSGWEITLRVNGVNTALTCQILGANVACNNVINQVAVLAGDLLSVEWAPINNPAVPGIIRQSVQMVIT